MIIKKLKLENFGKIKEADLDFNEGIILILGQNYQGKSHIMKAIAFMLIDHTYKKIGYFCNWEASFFKTYMEFSHCGKTFIVDYYYDKNSDKLTRKLNIDGQPFIGESCVQELEKYFKPSICKASILSPQGELDLINTKPSQRREDLKKIFDLEFDSQILHLKKLKEGKETQLKEISDRILVLENKTYDTHELDELPYTEEEILLLRNELTVINNKINSINVLQKKFDDEVENIENLKRSNMDHEKKITDLNTSLFKEEEKFKKLSKVTDDSFYANKNLLIKKLEETDWNVGVNQLIGNQNKLIDKRVSPVNPEILSNLKKDRENLLPLFYKIRNKLESSNKGICSECGHTYIAEEKENIKNEFEEKNNQLKEIDAAIEVQENLKKKYDDTIEFNRKNSEERNKLQIKITNEKSRIMKEKENLQKEISNEDKLVESEKKNLKNQIESIQNSINFLKLQKTDKKNEIENNLKKIEDIKKDHAEIRPTILEEDSIKENTLNENIKNYDNTIERNKTYERQNKEILENKEKDTKELAGKRLSRDGLTLDIGRLDKAIVIFNKEFPNFVIDSTVSEIEMGMNEFLSGVYFGQNQVKIKKGKDGIDVVYGKQENPMVIASGFEKELFNVAYKDSFATKAGLGLMCLDEIDSFASEENSKILFEAIASLTDRYQQMFIITHKASIQDILIRDCKADTFIVENGVIRRY